MRSGRGWLTQWRMVLAATICASVFCVGCGSRVILVAPGEPVRLRETVRGAKVWAADGQGREVPAVVDLPEGWWVLPDPGPEK